MQFITKLFSTKTIFISLWPKANKIISLHLKNKYSSLFQFSLSVLNFPVGLYFSKDFSKGNWIFPKDFSRGNWIPYWKKSSEKIQFPPGKILRKNPISPWKNPAEKSNFPLEKSFGKIQFPKISSWKYPLEKFHVINPL